MDSRDDTPSRSVAHLTSWLVVVALAAVAFVGTVTASNAAVGLDGASQESLSIPRWLYVATGGAVIGASGLLASFVTDRRFIESIHSWRRSLGDGRTVRRGGRLALSVLGLLLLSLTVFLGFTGPQVPTVNFAIVLVFAGMRAGFTMTTYLFGNVWPALNPWRTVAELLPKGFVTYPKRFGRWPAVAGLLALVWVETATGVTRLPSSLATALVVYSVLTVAGAVLFGPDDWFDFVDPVSVFFAFYGRVAPLTWTREGLQLHLPGMRLVEDGFVDELADVAFVVALVWELTFSGFVTTTAGASFVEGLAGLGLPPLLIYGVSYLGGFAAFLGLYLLAARFAANYLRTYRSARELAVRFAPPLLAIAAGYHLAHYFGFFVSLSPSLVTVLVSPFTPSPNPLVLSLPAWFGSLNVVFVLLGHLFAVWAAHSIAYGLFPSRLQAIRSQYSFVLVMMLYTALSLWLISLPTTQPPFL
ncbi:hypothetical protein SAMN04487948_109119 [Halogranum amylolyticum]|uniref:Uncharacterized protein n=1 Tax=Halogranum amylolyticum TaxID=660520 RepID=A0A1H8U3M8_9EURY|nr:hypothetical protein [Halogranum amylolyticum]SEO97880.1 hypothetical protein SAMN04487948_109119 [Halogranum amylolyticum]